MKIMKKVVYVNRKNEAEQAQLVDTRKEGKFVLILEDGTEKLITESTLKRWWKKTEIEVPDKQAKNNNRKPREMKPEIEKLMNYAFDTAKEQGAEIWSPAKDIKMRAFKVNGKMAIKFNYSNRSITLNCRSKAVAGLDGPDHVNNHCFDYSYQFVEDTKQDRKLIKDLIKASIKYITDKEQAKQKKSKEAA